MISVKGKFQNGVALPLEPVKESREGQIVIITFLEENGAEILTEKAKGVQSLEDLLAKCEVDTGISDLAEQHDYYLYGKPKK
ncbi:MAG TPA: hypothetical protein VF644_17705 [Pyrinomonadaceae bacterium]|jgi:predicted DNA-binding antitoxin AbrB/MazE fold protein